MPEKIIIIRCLLKQIIITYITIYSMKPIKALRKGNLSASLFFNQTPKGDPYLQINLKRGYKINGVWKNPNISFTINQASWILYAVQQLRDYSFEVINANKKAFSKYRDKKNGK